MVDIKFTLTKLDVFSLSFTFAFTNYSVRCFSILIPLAIYFCLSVGWLNATYTIQQLIVMCNYYDSNTDDDVDDNDNHINKK